MIRKNFLRFLQGAIIQSTRGPYIKCKIPLLKYHLIRGLWIVGIVQFCSTFFSIIGDGKIVQYLVMVVYSTEPGCPSYILSCMFYRFSHVDPLSEP